jgi:DNA polymerase III subunit gamma/tau
MYYLKHRPQTLEEIDNLKVRETMSRIIDSQTLPHAFLFVGQKGTGKTSTARIFAKRLNCLKPKGINPCNHCSNCLSVNSSSSPDVVELDAASNRGINEIKDLIKEAAFSPMTGKYRVFIIDEAHMITPDGFNALLKTLEEPPETVVFILATTNLEKVPKTIVSRCLVVNFGRAKKQEIKQMILRISLKENLKVDDKIISLVAAHSENSFRDAAKILEELVIQNKLTVETAQDYLGLRGKQNLLQVINKEGLKQTLTWIEEFSQAGGSVKNLLEELLEELRLALLAKNGIKIDDEINIDFSLVEITILMKLFNEAYSQLKISPVDTIPLEIAAVEFYNQHKK